MPNTEVLGYSQPSLRDENQRTLIHRVSPIGPQQESPGQSAALGKRAIIAEALQGRNNPHCSALAGNAVKDYFSIRIGVLVNWEI